MIKEIEVVVPESRVKRKHYVCDFCGHEEPTMPSCCICHKHVCRKWNGGCREFDVNDPTDYPSTYCPICFKLRFITYKNKFDYIEMRAEKEEDALWKKIKKETQIRYNKVQKDIKSIKKIK